MALTIREAEHAIRENTPVFYDLNGIIFVGSISRLSSEAVNMMGHEYGEEKPNRFLGHISLGKLSLSRNGTGPI